MEDQIIIAVILIVALLAGCSTVKYFTKKRGCCGGSGSYKPRKKKLKHVTATKTFRVEGMHCEKCSGRVMETVNDIPGVAASVNLKSGIVTVTYEQEVPDEQIIAKIQRLGYTVTGID